MTNFYCCTDLDLMSEDNVDEFIATATEVLGGRPAALVVVDTLARSMYGGDENSAKDMGVVIGSCDEIRERLGCAVLIVHHTGKKGEIERGSTALRGSADLMLKCSQNGCVVTLGCDKCKDGDVEKHIRQSAEAA